MEACSWLSARTIGGGLANRNNPAGLTMCCLVCCSLHDASARRPPVERACEVYTGAAHGVKQGAGPQRPRRKAYFFSSPYCTVDIFFNSPAWYVLLLLAGLATGFLIAWTRTRRGGK